MKPEAIQTDQFWRIDYRLYNPEGAGKSPLDHVRDMLLNIDYQKWGLNPRRSRQWRLSDRHGRSN